MKLGDVIWADLGPEDDSCIQRKRRPVIVFCNEQTCTFSPVITVIPITSSTDKKPLPTHFRLSNLKKPESIILPEQIQTINKRQLIGNPVYRLNPEELSMVVSAVKLQLGII